MTGDAQPTWSRWLRGVASCGLLAVCVALPLWGIGWVLTLLAPVLVAGTTGAALAVLGHDRAGAGDGPTPPDRSGRPGAGTWWCLVVAACTSSVVCAAVAAAVAPALVPLWFAALALTTPPVRARLVRHLRPEPAQRATSSPHPEPERAGRPPDDVRPARDHEATEPGPTTGVPRPGVPDDPRCAYVRITDLGTAELCHLWRVTYWAVRDTRSPTRARHVVEVRHAVLDELEKRHPEAVARWLRSGHHGADGPARYL